MKQERRETPIHNQDLPPQSTDMTHGCSSWRVSDSGGYEYANQSNLDFSSSFRAMDSAS